MNFDKNVVIHEKSVIHLFIQHFLESYVNRKYSLENYSKNEPFDFGKN